MAATGFADMWNPECIYYDGDVGRIFHRKWHGLSFAHEVEYEKNEDPIGNFGPIAERMKILSCRQTFESIEEHSEHSLTVSEEEIQRASCSL